MSLTPTRPLGAGSRYASRQLRDSSAPRHDEQPRARAEPAAVEVAVALGVLEAGSLEHRQQLGDRVDADRPGARLTLTGAIDQRHRGGGDAGGGVERALLEQQPAFAQQPPVAVGPAQHEQVAVHRLDHQPAAGAQHAADLGEYAGVLLDAEVAERAEQVQRGIEARVRERQLAVVGLHELRPALVPGAAARLTEQRGRAIDAGDPISGTREGDRMAAVAARYVDQLGAGFGARELRRAKCLALALVALLVGGVRAQVEIAEERVPGLG